MVPPISRACLYSACAEHDADACSGSNARTTVDPLTAAVYSTASTALGATLKLGVVARSGYVYIQTSVASAARYWAMQRSLKGERFAL